MQLTTMVRGDSGLGSSLSLKLVFWHLVLVTAVFRCNRTLVTARRSTGSILAPDSTRPAAAALGRTTAPSLSLHLAGSVLKLERL